MNNKRKSVGKFVFFAVLIPVIILFILVFDYNRSIDFPNSRDDEKVSIEIKEGESVNEILEKLLDNELISQKNFYYSKIYLRLNNLGAKLQAGKYNLPRDLTLVELIETLQLGRSDDVWVTIPEGLRKDEIADIIDRELTNAGSTTFSKSEFLSLTTNQEFIDTLELQVEVNDLEGFLFPDRYSLPKELTAEQAIQKLVDNFNEKIGDREYTYEDIIFASIVEREGYNKNDRPIIAGIILKRFEEGWLLQTDATLLYPVKDWQHTITIQDKEDDNPYNTYRYLGLPPTPICNPGLESIEAVWNPVETDYYFYIHGRDGNPHYGRTLDEHNANINRYLR